MSYILDALKKAESERRLGAVPNVHAQPMPHPALDDPSPTWRRLAMLGGAATLLAVLGVLAWQRPWEARQAAPAAGMPEPAGARGAEPPSATMDAVPAPLSGGPDAAPASSSARMTGEEGSRKLAHGSESVGEARRAGGAVAEGSRAVGARPAQPQPVEPRRAEPRQPEPRQAEPRQAEPRAAVSKQAESKQAESKQAESKQAESKQAESRRVEPRASNSGPAESSLSPVAAGESRVAKAASTASTAAPDESVPAWRDLPERLRREMPPVTIGGYIYAANPADRSAIINGKLVREGESVAPGLRLERMLPKEAIMDYQGQRYRVAY